MTQTRLNKAILAQIYIYVKQFGTLLGLCGSMTNMWTPPSDGSSYSSNICENSDQELFLALLQRFGKGPIGFSAWQCFLWIYWHYRTNEWLSEDVQWNPLSFSMWCLTSNTFCFKVSCYHRFPERHEWGRDKRDVTEKRKQRKKRQSESPSLSVLYRQTHFLSDILCELSFLLAEQHTFLHLVPVSSQSYSECNTHSV